MVWGAIIAGGATLLGSALQSRGVKRAGESQERSSQGAIEGQLTAQREAAARTQPFADIGLSAGPALAQLLGLPAPITQEERDIRSRIDALDQTIAAGPQQTRIPGFAGRNLPGGRAFLEAASNALGVGEDQAFDEQALTNERQELQGQLDALSQERPQASQLPQDPGGLLAQANPLVSFLRDQGFEDIQESAAAQGRLGAGGTLQDLTEFNTQIASTVVPQLQQQRFNQLFNVLGLGSNAAAGQSSQQLQTASNISGIQQALGAARGQQAVTQANIGSGLLNNLAGIVGAHQGGAFRGVPPQQDGGFQSTDITNPNRFGGIA